MPLLAGVLRLSLSQMARSQSRERYYLKARRAAEAGTAIPRRPPRIQSYMVRAAAVVQVAYPTAGMVGMETNEPQAATRTHMEPGVVAVQAGVAAGSSSYTLQKPSTLPGLSTSMEVAAAAAVRAERGI